MRIKLDDYYSTYTNGISEHEVEGHTVKECVLGLCNRYPQLYAQMIDNDYADCCRSSLSIDGEYLVCRDSAANMFLKPGQLVELRRDIPEGAGEVVRWIGTIILLVVAVVLTIVSWGAASPLVAMVYGSLASSFFVAAAVSAVATAITYAFDADTPEAMSPTLLLNSASYTFSGAQNTTAIGTAIPVVYGTHRVGGHWLNIYTELEDITETISGEDVVSNNSILYGQLGICEGEITGISDVFVNQLPLSFYNEVETAPADGYYKLGAATQDSMPAFTATMNNVSVGRKILNTTTPLPTINPLYTEFVPVYGVVEFDPYNAAYTWKKGKYTPTYYEVDDSSPG